MMKRFRAVVLCLVAGTAVQCYTPDLSTQVYKCDRGKCPEDFYCIDTVYCTQRLEECGVGGVRVSPEATVCIGRSDPNNPATICSGSASAMKCTTAGISGTLCTGVKDCAYCCK